MILCTPRREDAAPSARRELIVDPFLQLTIRRGATFLAAVYSNESSPQRRVKRNQKWLHLRYPARLMRARKFSRLSLHHKSIGFALRAASGTSTATKFFSMSATPISPSSSSFPAAWKLCSRASTVNAPSPSIVPAASPANSP